LGRVVGMERHGYALDGAATYEGGGDKRRGVYAAKVFETGEYVCGERELVVVCVVLVVRVSGWDTAEADFDDVGLSLEEAGEDGVAAHRGGEYFEREGTSLEDPRKGRGVVCGGEVEAEVRKAGESLEGAMEETEKVGCELRVVPFEVEAMDETRIEIVAGECFDEMERLLRGKVDQRTIEHASSDVVKDGTDRQRWNEFASRKLHKHQLERFCRK
jgi:hypothetical protein